MKKLIISSIFAIGFSSIVFAKTDASPSSNQVIVDTTNSESHKHNNHNKKMGHEAHKMENDAHEMEHKAHEIEHKAHKMEHEAREEEHKAHKIHKDHTNTESNTSSSK